MANITDDVEPSPPKKAKTTTCKGADPETTKRALNADLAAETASDPPKPREVRRLEYKPPRYRVTRVSLDFKLRDRRTVVESVLTVERNDANNDADNDNGCEEGDRGEEEEDGLVLDGEERVVSLLSLAVDGIERPLVPNADYALRPNKLIVKSSTLEAGAAAARGGGIMVVRTVVSIVPEDNTALSGLYRDGEDGMYCTQCEAEGFRRITYYPDRPDNVATFERVRVEADADRFPVLLSNGNLVEEGEVESSDDGGDSGGRRRKFAVWSDPYPKPSYLFALVAGDLGHIEGSFQTMSGRNVSLRFFSEKKDVNKLDYALESLKRAMRWDEETFGLEYDLDVFMVVAVDSFNMGAMENKGLNVFNTSCVLADPTTSTDDNYLRVEGIIGHEYFHNWTGNRVTLRDWFQLTLKEGLTVFRDQQFSGQVNGTEVVNRIENVLVVRGSQFKEDGGPMSHPIRPDSYIAMDNFYTSTVYRKGAEVIRMYDTLLGTAGFRKGMDLYFERHDGSAVTCDEFLAAMGDANGVDLSQFARWYCTSGTPVVTYSSTFDAEKGLYRLTLSQSSRSDEPLLIPVVVGLLDKQTGEEVVPTTVLQLKEVSQTFDFPDLRGDVVPSILRNFSAPVKVVPADGSVDENDLAFLASNDTDGFNRWDAAQKLYEAAILKVLNEEPFDGTLSRVLESFGRTLDDGSISDDSMRAYALILPSESALAQSVAVVDPPAIRSARKRVKKAIARKYKAELLAGYEKLSAAIEASGDVFKVDGISVGRRRLRNCYLGYLCAIDETGDEQKEAASLATKHFDSAKGMTDKLAAFNLLASMTGEGEVARDAAIQKFYDDAAGDSLVLNKWFAVQASSDLPDVLDRVIELMTHSDFSLKNPNRCRSLVVTFAMNAASFHDIEGKGYEFLGDIIQQLDALNPKVAARTTAISLVGWKRYDEKRATLMKAQLEKLKNLENVSNDLLEICTKGLK